MKRIVTALAWVLGFAACVLGGCASKAKPDAAAVVDAGADVAPDVEDAGGDVGGDVSDSE